jgi:hypothetical protein
MLSRIADLTCISGTFGVREGTCRSELAAGVRSGGGQPESKTTARRLLAVDQPCGPRASLGGEAGHHAC